MLPPNAPLYAAIDLGSNTIRLLIAGVTPDGRKLAIQHSRREVTRLGSGLRENGSLDRKAVRRSEMIVRDYIREAAHYSATWMVAVGTAALRDSHEGSRFAEAMQQSTGLKLNIIDQRTEALLTTLGAGLVLGDEKPLVMVDIGGRTTEIACQKKNTSLNIVGLPLGALRLQESFISSDPPHPSEVDRLLGHIRDILSVSPQCGHLPENAVLVGTGGTFTTLAALDMGLGAYDREKINGYILKADSIKGAVRILSSIKRDERTALPGMEHGREDIIIPGAHLALAIMKWFSRGSIVISDSGILEGCILACLRGNPILERCELQNIKISKTNP